MLTLSVLMLGCGSGGNKAVPVPTVGPNIQSICVSPGTPVPPPATATPVAPTPAPTPCATSTTVAACGQYPFHATATLSDGSTTDITNSSSTFWTTNNFRVLQPDQNQRGVYFANCNTGPNQCPVMIGATSGSVNSEDFTATVTGLQSCGP